MKGEKLKLARQIAERHFKEFEKESSEKDPTRFRILAARKMERASGLLYSDCVKFVEKGRW